MVGARLALGIGVLAAAIGAAIGGLPEAQPLALFLAVILAAHTVGSVRLSVLLVVAVFISRFRFEVLGLGFLPEHAVGLALLLALVLEGRRDRLIETACSKPAIWLAAFIGWLAVTSILNAPEPMASLRIVGWLGLDWIILVCLLTSIRSSERLERVALTAGLVVAGVAVALWIGLSLGVSELGTQPPGTAGGDRAVFALAYEANLLASLLAVWAFLGLSSQHANVRRLTTIGLPLYVLAILASLTRAAAVGLLLGLVVWGLTGGVRARRILVRVIGAGALVAAVALVTLPSLFEPLQERLATALDFGSGTAVPRTQAAELAIDDLGGLTYLTGLGANSFGQFHLDPTNSGEPFYLPSLPLQVLHDGGLIAVVLLLGALWSIRPAGGQQLGRALGALVVYLAAAAATSPFWFGWTWVVIALAILLRREGLADEYGHASDRQVLQGSTGHTSAIAAWGTSRRLTKLVAKIRTRVVDHTPADRQQSRDDWGLR